MTPHDSTRCACGHEEREHGTMLEGDGPCLGNGYRCECREFAPTPSAGVGAVDGYATIEEVWNWVANELDETRTPEDAARLKAAMEALVPTRAPRADAGAVASEVEHAIRSAMDFCHNSQEWEQEGGAWATYIAPMLAALAAAEQGGG